MSEDPGEFRGEPELWNPQGEKIVWTCSQGCHFSEFELEMGMSWATAEYLSEQAWLEHELDGDLEREATLARRHALGELDCPWPWYADKPIEVQEPEVIDA